ncbi:MAG TPA: hypothetical protein VN947_31225 [Polyangia bacterium]|nr:hypothetical protein [Polyangia bacterium]
MRRALALSLILAVTAAPMRVRADESLEKPEADFRHFSDYAWFVLGAGAGFVGHEMGHMMMDVFFGKSVSFVGVSLGPIPFFAIQPCCNLTPRENWVIGSAGFVVGDVSSELILQIAPTLRSHRHAFLKGVLMFDILLAAGYAVTGFAGIGPPQSDVNTMARGIGVPAWQVGVMLMVPAAVDMYRYFVPRSVWAPWTSISGKTFLLGVGFVL